MTKKMNTNKMHVIDFVVREYECDQGQGVNNAVYLNYLEHARFEYIRSFLGWDLKMLLKNDIGFVVQRIEIDFKRSLESNNEFCVESVMQRTSQRQFKFDQNIYLKSKDGNPVRKLIASAVVMCTSISVKTGRSDFSPLLEDLLTDFPVPRELSTAGA